MAKKKITLQQEIAEALNDDIEINETVIEKKRATKKETSKKSASKIVDEKDSTRNKSKLETEISEEERIHLSDHLNLKDEDKLVDYDEDEPFIFKDAIGLDDDGNLKNNTTGDVVEEEESEEEYSETKDDPAKKENEKRKTSWFKKIFRQKPKRTIDELEAELDKSIASAEDAIDDIHSTLGEWVEKLKSA